MSTTFVKTTVSFLLVIAVLCGLCWRLTIGLDLSDEAYYADFIDDWLKGGIATSTHLMLHQTAALIVYPAAVLYYRLHGSTDGLLLFLRCLFLLGNCLAAGIVFLYLRRLIGGGCALALGLAFLCFIPFTLPAPSYNTLALQCMTIALAALGSASLARSARAMYGWLTLSALGWGMVVIAYPTLIAVPPVLCLLLLVFLRRHAVSAPCTALTGAATLIAVAVMVGVLSWAKLRDSFIYLAAFNGSANFHRKFEFALTVLHYNPGFVRLCIAAMLLGILRPWIGDKSAALILCALFLGLLVFFPLFPGAMLFLSHDMIALVALFGLGLLPDLRSPDANRRMLAVLYAASLFAGLVIVASATNGIRNFAVGAAPAALLSIAATGRTLNRPFALAAAALFAWILFIGSMALYFGDSPRIVVERQRVTWGAAKGLAVRLDQFAVINAMRDVVLPLMRPNDTILVLGGSPGLVLQTPARIKAYSIYPMTYLTSTPRVQVLTHKFYMVQNNRPDIVVIYHDLNFINPFGRDFARWYAPVADRSYSGRLLEVFRKRPE